METKDLLQAIISLITITIAIMVYLSSRKLYILDVANKRAEKVNSVFKDACIGTKIASIVDHHYVSFWSETISEIVISQNILNKLSGKNKIMKCLLGHKNVQYIFWEQLHTTVRLHFKSYTDTNLIANNNDDQNTIIRKQQIKDIINTYLIL